MNTAKIATPIEVTITIEGGVVQDVQVQDANGDDVEFVYVLNDLDCDDDR